MKGKKIPFPKSVLTINDVLVQFSQQHVILIAQGTCTDTTVCTNVTAPYRRITSASSRSKYLPLGMESVKAFSNDNIKKLCVV